MTSIHYVSTERLWMEFQTDLVANVNEHDAETSAVKCASGTRLAVSDEGAKNFVKSTWSGPGEVLRKAAPTFEARGGPFDQLMAKRVRLQGDHGVGL